MLSASTRPSLRATTGVPLPSTSPDRCTGMVAANSYLIQNHQTAWAPVPGTARSGTGLRLRWTRRFRRFATQTKSTLQPTFTETAYCIRPATRRIRNWPAS
ncbi:hypothetical protein HDV63DRAFT_385733 [Trichoderma sp. SZMC 28014]